MASRNRIFYSLTKRPKLGSLLESQDNKGSLQKANWGKQYLWAEKFGDLITADHRVLKEGNASRHTHRYSVVVQDLATHWTQSYPCKTKTSEETERSLRQFLELSEKPKVVCTDNSLEFGQSYGDLSWNHRTSTPTSWRKSSAQNKGRNICHVVAIWFG